MIIVLIVLFSWRGCKKTGIEQKESIAPKFQIQFVPEVTKFNENQIDSINKLLQYYIESIKKVSLVKFKAQEPFDITSFLGKYESIRTDLKLGRFTSASIKIDSLLRFYPENALLLYSKARCAKEQLSPVINWLATPAIVDLSRITNVVKFDFFYDNLNTALKYYLIVFNNHSNSNLADDAAGILASLLYRLNHPDDAFTLYKRIIVDYPNQLPDEKSKLYTDLKACMITSLMRNRGSSTKSINKEIYTIYSQNEANLGIMLSSKGLNENERQLIEDYLNITKDFYSISMYGLVDMVINNYKIKMEEVEEIYQKFMLDGRRVEAEQVATKFGSVFRLVNEYISLTDLFQNHDYNIFLNESRLWLNKYKKQNSIFNNSIMMMRASAYDAQNKTIPFFNVLNELLEQDQIMGSTSSALVEFNPILERFEPNNIGYFGGLEDIIEGHILRNRNAIKKLNIEVYNKELILIYYSLSAKIELIFMNYERAFELKNKVVSLAKNNYSIYQYDSVCDLLTWYSTFIDQLYYLNHYENSRRKLTEEIERYKQYVNKITAMQSSLLTELLEKDLKEYFDYFYDQILTSATESLYDIITNDKNVNLFINRLPLYIKLLKRKEDELLFQRFLINNLLEENEIAKMYVVNSLVNLKYNDSQSETTLTFIDINFYKMLNNHSRYRDFLKAYIIIHSGVFDYDNFIGLSQEEKNRLLELKKEILRKGLECLNKIPTEFRNELMIFEYSNCIKKELEND